MAKNIVNVALVSLLIFLLDGYICFAGEVEWQEIGRGNADLRTLLVHPDNPRIIYIGSKNAIFKTEDGSQSWRGILFTRGQNKGVNFLLFDRQDKDSLYAATGAGLYYSPNQGKSWKRIFKSASYLENECKTLAILPYAIYLGTRAGLFISKDNGRSWHKESAKLGNSHILAIAYNLKEPAYVYVACIDGVFRTSNSGQSWERIFVSHPTEDGDDAEEKSDDQQQEEQFSEIRHLSIDPNDLSCLYLATSKGVYRSQDRGLTWEAFPGFGLLSQDVRFLLVSQKSCLYAATKSGVFKYEADRWQELSLRLAVGEVNFLDTDNQDNLYAACDKGLFKANIGHFSDNKQDNIITAYYKDEPKIKEVQEAAIKYAEVEPGKIIKWRQQAGKKALLPQVSIGIDRNSTDLWHWEGGSTTKTDDDILRRGRDSIDWDVTLSWDLGELIWSDDQTNIDVRSRLMVQLRNDILDEVTRLYFERLRVKMELDNLSIEDRKKRLEKEMRLGELTASIDALTGGYFSSYTSN